MKRLAVNLRDETINISLPATGVLSAIVCVVDRSERDPASADEVTLELGGLDSTDGMHLNWGRFDLQPGDSVTITVHDDRQTDVPTKRTGTTPEQDMEAKRNYLRRMADELGWTITESS